MITGELSASQLWKALSVNALKCLYQEPLKIQIGQRAEFIVFAPPTAMANNSESTKISFLQYLLVGKGNKR